MPTALIFRERILAPSETFIYEQARFLTRYQPVLTGLRRTVPALSHQLPEVLMRQGASLVDQVAVNLYRRLPFSPGYLAELRALEPGIVHAHFATDAVQALSISRRLNIPLVVSLHGYDVTSTEEALRSSFAGRHYLRNRQRLFRYASAFLCVSRFIRDIALEAGFPREKLHVHYTGIDCAHFQPSSLSRDPNLVLFVGRLVEKKGCEHALRAMAKVQRILPEARLEIIGDGPLRPALQSLSAELSVNAVFRGVQPPAEVCRSMSRARILCNPSVTAPGGDREGFGMVFAEAQAVGTPVVTYAHAAIPEAVSHGETGLIAKERDTEALADALVMLLQQHELWQRMSLRSVTWVRENFDLGVQTRQLEALYDQCVDRRMFGQTAGENALEQATSL